MQNDKDTVLRIEHVFRAFPRDISDTHFSVLSEMFLPSKLLNRSKDDYFFALNDINLSLKEGQKLGVIGAHRSGKSTLAGMASGLFLPTFGNVFCCKSRQLISRPAAGFRSILTVIENLKLTASLAGLYGESLDDVIEKSLSRYGFSHSQATLSTGNISPQVIKQLALTLMLEIPSEILIVDEVSAAGAGDARWLTRGHLCEKIEACTSLVISTDFNFLRDLVKHAVVLVDGKLYGPFELDEAIEYFRATPEIRNYDNQVVESFSADFDVNEISQYAEAYPEIAELDKFELDEAIEYFRATPEIRNYDNQVVESFSADLDVNEISQCAEAYPEIAELDKKFVKDTNLPWQIKAIVVDGLGFRHTNHSLVREVGKTVDVSVEMAALRQNKFTGGMFVLHGGSSELELCKFFFEYPEMEISRSQVCILNFKFVVPDLGEAFYGLSFTPKFDKKEFPFNHRLKLVIFGVGEKSHLSKQALQIIQSNFTKKS